MGEDKPYTIAMEDRGEYLYAIVGGLQTTPEIAMTYWREVIDKCEELGISRVLMEHDFVETISMPEVVEIMGPLSDLLRDRKIAFIDRFAHDDVSELGKKMARSRNVMVQIFSDTAKAEKWLLAN